MSDSYPSWLRPVVMAGTAAAALGISVYCWRSYLAAVSSERKFVVVGKSSVSSYREDQAVGEEGEGHASRTSERAASKRGDLCEDDGRYSSTREQADDVVQFISQQSFGPQVFDEEETDGLGELPQGLSSSGSHHRADSIHPGSSINLLPSTGSNPFGSEIRKRVLMLGLDSAGKSTLLHQLSNFEMLSNHYIPTEGFRVMALAAQNCTFDLFEVGGSEKNRAYWAKFLDKVDLMLFVVDSCSSPERLELGCQELQKVLGDPRMDGIPLLLVATHQDRLESRSPDELAVIMDLDSYSAERHLCRPIGVALHPGDPPEGIAKLRSWMFPVLARAMEIQDDKDEDKEDEDGNPEI